MSDQLSASKIRVYLAEESAKKNLSDAIFYLLLFIASVAEGIRSLIVRDRPSAAYIALCFVLATAQLFFVACRVFSFIKAKRHMKELVVEDVMNS